MKIMMVDNELKKKTKKRETYHECDNISDNKRWDGDVDVFGDGGADTTGPSLCVSVLKIFNETYIILRGGCGLP